MADLELKSEGEKKRKVFIKKKTDINQRQQEKRPTHQQQQTVPNSAANKSKILMTISSKKAIIEEASHTKGHRLVTNDVGSEKKALLNHSTDHQESSAIHIKSESPLDEIKPAIDPAMVVQKFNLKSAEVNVPCKICGKHVYQMEKLKAEKTIFHKLCFRCKECNKLLTVDNYSSHEGSIYCKQHFRQLFQPKVQLDSEDDPALWKQRKQEMIIRENIPEELPPDVIRCDSKADYGLESLPSLLNVKSRFESGLLGADSQRPPPLSPADIHRSESMMQRLARYESAARGEKGASSDSEDDEGESHVINRESTKKQVPFATLSNLKSQWEKGAVKSQKGEIIEMKKEEKQRLQHRKSLGCSGSKKLEYEQACHEATTTPRGELVVVDKTHTEKLKEKFEKGHVINGLEHENHDKMRSEKLEDLSAFSETGISHDARRLFKKMEANANDSSPVVPLPRQLHKTHPSSSNKAALPTGEVVKCSEPNSKEPIQVESKEISQRFKFFENYHEEPKERKKFQITPPRESLKSESPEPDIQRDPSVVRCTMSNGHDEIPITDTARKMLGKFKAMEEAREQQPASYGPKPLKQITPPREFTAVRPPVDEDENVVRHTYRVEDEINVEADRAKNLRAKFERWQQDIATSPDSYNNEEDDFMPQLDTAKNLRAKFEAINGQPSKEKPKPAIKEEGQKSREKQKFTIKEEGQHSKEKPKPTIKEEGQQSKEKPKPTIKEEGQQSKEKPKLRIKRFV